MSETSRELQAELERVTSRGASADESLSKDAAELREGWLAWQQLLDASDRSFDPQALLAKLEQSPSSPDQVSMSAATPAPTSAATSGWWKQLPAVVVAASLLAAVALAAWQAWNSTSRNPVDVPVARQPAEDRGAAEANGATGTDLASGADSAPETAWEDSFDEQLAVTQQRIWQARGTATASEVRFESLRQAVELIESELSSNSL